MGEVVTVSANGRGFPTGARVLIDGRDEARVNCAWPEGSWHYPWPHYKVDIVGGDQNVTVPWKSVGVDRAPTNVTHDDDAERMILDEEVDR